MVHSAAADGWRLRAWHGLQAPRDRLWPLVLATLLVGAAWLRLYTRPPACRPLRAADAASSSSSGAWPSTGEGVHVVFTSNGAPYVNYQTLVLLGSYRRAKRLPGGEHMAGLTRILHRSAHDALSAVVPTWRAQPLHPECDGAVPVPGQPCKYVVADRPDAVRQFLEAARTQPSLIRGAWLYLIETDFVFVKPVAAPGRAEDPGLRPLAYRYAYITPGHPQALPHMRRLYPPGLGPLSDIPHTGPSPVLARPADWLRVLPRWQGLTAQIEADPEAAKGLGWTREMYAFCVAAAVERLGLELQEAPNSTLIAQPPLDLALGRATQIHYTWGPKLLLASDGSEAWRFEKRDYVGPRVQAELPKPPLPPPFEEGRFRTPSVRTGPQGAPTLREHYETLLLEVQTVRAAIDEVGGARWPEVLRADPGARAAAELMALRP